MMVVSTISYIDRNTLALLAPTILREAHLSNEQYGFIISAFSVAYMLGNPLWGYALDRIGVRAGMTADRGFCVGVGDQEQGRLCGVSFSC